MRSALHFEDLPSTRIPLALVFTGAFALGFGLYATPERAWLNVLLNGFYVLSLAASAAFFIASQLMTGARWSACLRRIPEAFMLLLPLGALFMLAVFLARTYIYPWSRAGELSHAPDAGGRAYYLDGGFVLLRLTVTIALWSSFVLMFRKTSLAQDEQPGKSLLLHRRLASYAGGFLVVFAPTFTLASYDWLLSLDARWFSTMFGVYVFAGTFVQGIAAVTLTAIILRQRGLLGSTVDVSHLHDLGKLLFAFSTFWAYIWLCQYLLIWYGNVPEEVTYYVRRTNGAWLFVFSLNFVVNWVVPFFALMSAKSKRSFRTLRVVATVLLFGHWLDLYLLVMPSQWKTPKLGVLEVMVPAALGALSYLVVLRGLSRAPLVPLNDPIMAADQLKALEGHA